MQYQPQDSTLNAAHGLFAPDRAVRSWTAWRKPTFLSNSQLRHCFLHQKGYVERQGFSMTAGSVWAGCCKCKAKVTHHPRTCLMKAWRLLLHEDLLPPKQVGLRPLATWQKGTYHKTCFLQTTRKLVCLWWNNPAMGIADKHRVRVCTSFG